MSLLQKLKTFVARCGAPAKFVAKTIVGVAVPGSGPVLELIDKLIDATHETVKDNLAALASPEDLQHIEKMFDVMLGDLQGVADQLKDLEKVPEDARKTLTAALRAEKHCLAAAKAIQEQVLQLSAVQAELKRLAAGQEYLIDLQRRFFCSHLDYLAEQQQHNVDPSQLDERLKRIEEAILADRRGDHERAETMSVALSREQPASAVLAVAVAASQAAGHQFGAAAKSLERAARLCPGDGKLSEMSRIATKYSRGITPVDPGPVASKRPKVGDSLGGWQLEQLLGFGGWGQVFRARHGDAVRAIKIMHAELSQNADFVKRFKREMSMLLRLWTHPHLVHIDPDHLFDKADDWGCWYYVMEFIEGTTLERELEKHGGLTLGQASLFTGIAQGLASAHALGIIHRDIKPANILIRKKVEAGQGQGVLVDFGLAGLVDPHSRGAGYTALFAAPEQMRHDTSDCRSDVYSLAATIYYCLLYGDAGKRDRFKAKLLPADIPAEVRRLLESCLDNDPDERPKDACAFVKDWSPSDAVAPRQSIWEPYTIKDLGIIMQPIHPKGWLSQPYSLSAHPVTRGQFRRFIRAANYKTDAEREGGAFIWTGSEWKADPKFNWLNPNFPQDDDHPVVCVTSDDADAFCQWLSKLMGQTYGLPTESQWEYACRGRALPSGGVEITSDPYHFGKTISPEHANYLDSKIGGTTKVGTYPGNGFGLFDMHGNVWEWCQDWFGEEMGQIMRGGSCLDDGLRCSAANCGGCFLDSNGYHDNSMHFSYRYRASDLGFRVAQIPCGA